MITGIVFRNGFFDSESQRKPLRLCSGVCMDMNSSLLSGIRVCYKQFDVGQNPEKWQLRITCILLQGMEKLCQNYVPILFSVQKVDLP